MTVSAELREQVEADIMSKSEVTPRNMMGTTAYMVRNRMFAFWVADGLVAKLPDHARQELLDRQRGVTFQGPQGRGFGDWTRLHLEKKDDVEHVLAAVKDAFEFVRGSAASQQKGKKKSRR